MCGLPPQAYAETKAMGEEAMCAACDGKDFLTVAIAPHQARGGPGCTQGAPTCTQMHPDAPG